MRQADWVIKRSAIYTLDESCPPPEAVAVRDGLVVALGTVAELDELRGPRTESLDLGKRALLPGFQDAHVHVSGGGLERSQCDLSDVHGLAEYLAIVSRHAAAHKNEPWITGGGWAMDVFPSGLASREDLDRAAPGRPVFLAGRDHHSAWASSRALELAGVTALTADPPGGRVERDGRGEATGTLQEAAMDLVTAVLPRATTEQIERGILEGQRYLHSLGITAWQEALVGSYAVVPDCFDAYVALHRSGQLKGHVVGALWWDRERGEAQLDELLSRREEASSCDRFKASSVKFMQDGVCENFSAAMSTPYLDGHGHETANSGTSFFDPEELKNFVVRADAEGFQCHFHAIGDRAVREVIDAVEEALKMNGPSDNRHCAARIQVVHPEDIPRFARVGLVANGQPLWACNEPQMTELTLPFIGAERSTWQYRFASLLGSGARLCFGSDWPVSSPNPLEEIYVVVNRTVPPGYAYGGAGPDEGPLIPDERLDVMSAVAAFTKGSAYLNHLEDKTGTIALGKEADLVVLDEDLFVLPPSEIASVEVDTTFVGGSVVYNAG